ncbi:Miro domain containing protein [Nitzschia inconspicua]|uniref:Miro domain containing protein n=1 Tax=Nitzschia inconspicua TaxID=303405 RepID=A0A9K3M402_9STRA|nr:Miro domain containing protein [Nitzschia inconspicua]
MEENANNVQSSKNDSNTLSIKKQKTRNILTDSTSPLFQIDEEDFENIQEILRLKFSDDELLSYAVCDVATIEPYSGQYRVTELKLRDSAETERSWYTQPHLPNSLCNLDALTKIQVYGTQIETFLSEDDDAEYPKVIPNLRILQLESMPRLQCLPSNLGSFTKLQQLKLKGLPINALPDSLSSLGESLEAVVITDCETLRNLPDGFGQLYNLQHLQTCGTPTQHLPANFGNLTDLQELEMEFQHLTQLPPGFNNLSNLHTLKTGLDKFNFPVPHLPNLAYLTTSVYNIHQFAQTQTVTEVDMYCHCDNATQASVLDLEFSHLSTWSNLESLQVRFEGHPFEYTLPKGSFTGFTKLNNLFLSCSKSQALGVYIDELPCLLQLNYLKLSGCVLKSTKPLAHPVTLLNLTSIYLYKMKGGLELLSMIRALCLSSISLNDCSPMDDVMFGNLCTSWFPHLKKLRSLRVKKCSIANIRPDHFHHLGETNVCSIDLQDNPIFHGSEGELERKLLPLVQHCKFLCDFSFTFKLPLRVAYHLCLNSARRAFVFGKQRIIAKGLWALIFEKAVEAMRGLTYYNKEQWSQSQAIYGFLKEFAVTEIYG